LTLFYIDVLQDTTELRRLLALVLLVVEVREKVNHRCVIAQLNDSQLLGNQSVIDGHQDSVEHAGVELRDLCTGYETLERVIQADGPDEVMGIHDEVNNAVDESSV